MTPPVKTERRAIVDTHRHPWGKEMQDEIEERGLLDPKHGFPQTNALDLMAYREVFDPDYAVPIHREGGVTLSLIASGGELAWLAQDLLRGSTVDAIKFFSDEYAEILNCRETSASPCDTVHSPTARM
jgi:hypothetical protein